MVTFGSSGAKLPIPTGLMLQFITLRLVPVTVAEIARGELRWASPLVGLKLRLGPVEITRVMVPATVVGAAIERTPMVTWFSAGGMAGAV